MVAKDRIEFMEIAPVLDLRGTLSVIDTIYALGIDSGGAWKLVKVNAGGLVKSIDLSDQLSGLGGWLAGLRNGKILVVGSGKVNSTWYIKIYEIDLDLGSVNKIFEWSKDVGTNNCPSNDAIYDPDYDRVIVAGWSQATTEERLGVAFVDLKAGSVQEYTDPDRYAAMNNCILITRDKYIVTVHGHVGGDIYFLRSDPSQRGGFTVPGSFTTGFYGGFRYLMPTRRPFGGWPIWAIEGGSGTGASQGIWKADDEGNFVSVSKPSGYEPSGIAGVEVDWPWLGVHVFNIGDDSGYFNPPYGLLLYEEGVGWLDLTSDIKSFLGVTNLTVYGRTGNSGAYDPERNRFFGLVGVRDTDTDTPHLLLILYEPVKGLRALANGQEKVSVEANASVELSLEAWFDDKARDYVLFDLEEAPEGGGFAKIAELYTEGGRAVKTVSKPSGTYQYRGKVRGVV